MNILLILNYLKCAGDVKGSINQVIWFGTLLNSVESSFAKIVFQNLRNNFISFKGCLKEISFLFY